ncbi:hypothetical protein HOP50_14g72990 [Chloropicon primus]|uniref:Uncharacterized protein n=1 Tax=Chloropicon primus TaxID=1764295 RepID=A0A5B8MYQ4_9CHLO|nr:hypothetical protein A3770_14p72800 [Chloropicon primus]UPR03968.1 hypothetical protein HOP50_14g72990 [Chloropicon primus]|mmetsp:Transcript_343/g.942  ORF Transcript_343/g.942 Transcript_343/m.942 type:complete len:231 (-) Transcript_343:825-1517(-)|eukprot:QDZ24762.1 hypothetical protein A3770_14p72800 [Chloropicon primus]
MRDIDALTVAAAKALNEQQQAAAAQGTTGSSPPTVARARPAHVAPAKPAADVQMPVRHSWELDWLSTELVKARQEVRRLKVENEQLKASLGQSSHHFSPVTQPLNPAHQALETILKSQAQHTTLLQLLQLQQALGNPGMQQAQTFPQPQAIASLIPTSIAELGILQQGKKAASDNLPTFSAPPQVPDANPNLEALKKFCDQASASPGRMDKSQVDSLLQMALNQAGKKSP